MYCAWTIESSRLAYMKTQKRTQLFRISSYRPCADGFNPKSDFQASVGLYYVWPKSGVGLARHWPQNLRVTGAVQRKSLAS